MARRKLAFKQSDLTRAIRAVVAAGVQGGRAEVDPADGKIVMIFPGKPVEPAPADTEDDMGL